MRGEPARARSTLLAGVAGVLLLFGGACALVACGGSGSARPGPGPSASGSSSPGGRPATRTPAPTSTADTAASRLLAQLRPFAVTDCRPQPSGDDGITAALTCVPGVSTAAPAPRAVSVFGYADAAALQADVGRRSAALTDVGDCARGQTSVERWAHSSRRRGTFLCSATPGRFSVFWTVDDEHLGFAAEDSDAARLLAWWRDYDPV